jgi:RNA polymerase sigma-54 factor
MRLTAHYLDLLAARDVGKLKKMLGIDDPTLRTARALILSLNPRPGAAFGADETHYVIPDVHVRKVKGMWIASLNADAMPKLRVNRVYADILSRHRESGGGQLASQLQEARWLIKNVQQRFDTILRVSQAIVDRQKHFFEHGEVAMRPLVLREIAEAVELHESTISRVTTQKFMMTPRGLYELKYFFGSHVATDNGGACSSTAIRALIKQLIAAESGKKPLSDGQLADVLGQQGIVVARRTVAKYRESLQIPPANMRRAL